MNRFALAPLALVVALSACGPSVSLTNASVEEVTKAVEKAGIKQPLKPGMWELKLETLDLDAPDMTADKKAAMKAMGNSTTSRCLTKEDVEKMKEVLVGAPSPQCKFATYTIKGGKVDMEMTCPGMGSGDLRVKSSATYTAESFITDGETDVPMPQGKVHSKVRITGKRTGDCTGKEGPSIPVGPQPAPQPAPEAAPLPAPTAPAKK